MSASQADHTCPLTNQQPTHWRVYRCWRPATVHFPPVQTSGTEGVTEGNIFQVLEESLREFQVHLFKQFYKGQTS